MAKVIPFDSSTDIKKMSEFINDSDGLLCHDSDVYRELREYFKPLADSWLEKTINRYVLAGKSELLLAQFNEQLRISERMEMLFGKILKYEITASSAQKRDLTIIEGIRETVRIKKDGIKEGMDDFKRGYMRIKSKNPVNIYISDEDKEQNFKECLEKWVELSKDESVTDFAKSLKRDSEISFKIKKDILKQKTDYEKILSELIFGFKRDIILSEIGTFEEMINHSINLLEQSENQDVNEFAAFVNGVYEELLSVIKNTGIEIIKPKPYEMFNSRENEVLIAEESDSFDKGQIIKTVLCGYKQGGTVILRANVIAAK
ncbi:MAG: nucleotide exchange factor GrpE [Defluviitaleaceae bacterium]|nr:nucleotide exchange factor GrpE [Defluviitaleaceae bacterium]